MIDFYQKIDVNRIYRAGLYLLFLLIPLLVFPWADDSYLIPKFVILELVTLYLATALLARQEQTSSNPFFVSNSVCVSFFAFVLWSAVTFFYAGSKTLAIHELTKWTFLFLLYLVILRVSRNSKYIYYAGGTLLTGAGITALWTILQDFHYFHEGIIARLPDWRGYLVAGLGNSDYVAGFLVNLVPVGVGLFFTVSRNLYRGLLLLFLVLCYAALIVTWSVGSNGGLIVGLLLMLFIFLKQRKIQNSKFKIRNYTWVLLFCMLLVTLFYVVPNPWNGRGESIFQQAFGSHRWKEGGSTRVVIWLNTFELIKRHPFFGVGTGNFTYRYLDTVSPKVLANPEYRIYAGEYTNAAHNEILQTWSETGIPGVILLIWLMSSFYKIAMRGLKKQIDSINQGLLLGSIGGMTALALYGMMSYPFHLPATCLSFLFLLSTPTVLLNSARDPLLSSSFIKEEKARRAIPLWFRIFRTMTVPVFLAVFSVWIVYPLLSEIYFRQGKMEKMMGNKEMAILDFETASRLSDNADAEYNLGEQLAQQGRMDEALEVFQQSAKQRKDKYIYNALANIYFSKKDYSKAIDYWKILTERDPQNPAYWNYLWVAYLHNGNENLANQAHEKMEQLQKGQ